MKILASLTSYPAVTSSASFKAQVLNLFVPTDWKSYYEQEWNKDAQIIVPKCSILPDLGYTVNYTIENLAQLPEFLTVGADN